MKKKNLPPWELRENIEREQSYVRDMKKIRQNTESVTPKIIIPKQWKHWAQSAGIKSDNKHCNYYMTGRGRRWRIDCFGKFEASCPQEHFDRWANSRGAEFPRLPQTKAEFLQVVKDLINQSKDAR